MHPAPSIIAFSTLSGLGFGLIAWLGLGAGQASGLAVFSLSVLAGRPGRRRPPRQPPPPRPAHPLSQGLHPVAQLLAQPRGHPRHRHPRRLRPLRGALAHVRPAQPLARPARRGAGARDGPLHRDDLRPAPQRAALAHAADAGAVSRSSRSPAARSSPAPPSPPPGSSQHSASPSSPPGGAAAASQHPAPRSPPPPASVPSAGCACSSRRIPGGTICSARWCSSSAAATR